MASGQNAFSFSRDFTRSGTTGPFVDREAHLPVPYPRHAELLDQARQEGFQRGVLAGRAQERDEEAVRLADALGQIAQRLAASGAQLAEAELLARREALDFALVFARKLAGKLVEAAPVAPIEATARAILSDLRGAPHVAVRVAPDLVDATKAQLTQLFRENGIELKLFVFPDPAIATGDCRIEWAEGGIVRDGASLETLIGQALDIVLARN